MLSIQKKLSDYTEAVVDLIKDTPLSADSFEQAGTAIRATELLVPVIGAFSAGKSSLINAFLQQEILAIGLTPETELATEIRYGPDPHLLALRNDGGQERIAVDDISGIKSRAGEFTHLQLYLDNPNLRKFSDLILVDMPGFDSSLENHNKAISHYLPRGAHFIVVTSVEDGNITRSMQRQLDELNTYARSFSYVLNKTNLRADEEVEQVAALIEEQIEQDITRIGRDGHGQMTNILSALEPEQIFKDIFIGRLQDMTQSLLSQIGVALAALNRDQTENERAQMELDQGIHRLLEKRDAIISQLHNQKLGRIVERCLNELESALESAREELVSAGLAGNQNGFSRIASDIIRATLVRVVNEEMSTLSHSVVSDLSGAISDMGDSFGEFAQDENWLEEMTGRISRGLEKTGDMLGSLTDWAESAAKRNKNRMVFQGLATVLAVTTSVVAPLIELAIIFLPSILAFFQKNRKRDEFTQKLMNEIIPAIKRKMRDELTVQLSQRMEEMINNINANFEQELGEKKRIMEQMGTTDKGEDIERRKTHLLAVKDKLQQLASNTLYQEQLA